MHLERTNIHICNKFYHIDLSILLQMLDGNSHLNSSLKKYIKKAHAPIIQSIIINRYDYALWLAAVY